MKSRNTSRNICNLIIEITTVIDIEKSEDGNRLIVKGVLK